MSRCPTDHVFALPRWPNLASRCEVCRSWPAQPVCQPCIARFASPQPRCQTCATTLPADLSMGLRTSPAMCMDCLVQPPLDQSLAAVSYAYPWSGLVNRYKFGNQPGWAPIFAALMAQAPGIREMLRSLEAADWILPIPLSVNRLQTRGFNQAWQLVRALAGQSGSAARTDARMLLRIKDTRPQSQLSRADRLVNVKDAFTVDPLRSGGLSGRRVVLVDDVMTSGASLFAAATALRQAGASHVSAVVFARTEE